MTTPMNPDQIEAILESVYTDPECGCPVEEWLMGGVCITLHAEPDGTLEMHADTGDWDADVPLLAETMDVARDEARAWVMRLPHEP